MSSRYVTGKKAASIGDTGSGAVFYAIFEEGYDSNIFPRDRRWGAALFAPAEKCMAAIIEVSPSCEGGSLKGPNGDITASAYVKQWRGTLRNASALATETVTLRFGEGTRRLSPENRSAIDKLLVACGRSAIQSDTLEINLLEPGSVELLGSMVEMQATTGVAPWKCLDVGDVRQAGLGIGVKLSPCPKVSLEGVGVWRIPNAAVGSFQEDNFIISIGGKASFAGWQYATVGRFIYNFVMGAEAATPGVAEGLIREFKQMVVASPSAPADTKVVLRRGGKGVRKHHTERFDQMAKALGLAGECIDTTIGQLAEAKQVYDLGNLCESQVTFDLAGVRAWSKRQSAPGDLFAECGG